MSIFKIINSKIKILAGKIKVNTNAVKNGVYSDGYYINGVIQANYTSPNNIPEIALDDNNVYVFNNGTPTQLSEYTVQVNGNSQSVYSISGLNVGGTLYMLDGNGAMTLALNIEFDFNGDHYEIGLDGAITAITNGPY